MGVGREEPRGCSGFFSQPQVGAAVYKVPGAVEGGESDGRWNERGRRSCRLLKGLCVDEGVFRRVQPDEADCIEGDGLVAEQQQTRQ
jgi:hypothetical protein